MAVGRPLFKGPSLFLPSAFISFHIAQSLHNIVKVSQVEWELHTKFIREAALLSHKDPLAFQTPAQRGAWVQLDPALPLDFVTA